MPISDLVILRMDSIDQIDQTKISAWENLGGLSALASTDLSTLIAALPKDWQSNISKYGVAVYDISAITTSLEVSWTMDAVSQLTARVYDSQMTKFFNNYFQVRRLVAWENKPFEMAVVEISQGDANGAAVTLECRRRQIQFMKRDKAPEAYGGVSATDYAAIVADRFGLNFVGEPTSTKRAITKSSNPDSDESVWDVLTKLAGDAQFSVFESDGTLYFASQEWLLGKWANLTFTYPSPNSSPYRVLEIPNCRRSDDDPMQAEVRFLLQRSETTMSLRPGMTINLSGMGEFDDEYLIAEVAYSIGVPDPIGVSCRTPVKKKTKNQSTT